MLFTKIIIVINYYFLWDNFSPVIFSWYFVDGLIIINYLLCRFSRKVLLFHFTFYRWVNWDSEELSVLPKVFSLASLEKAGYEPVLSDPPKLLLAAVEKKANFKKKKKDPWISKKFSTRNCNLPFTGHWPCARHYSKHFTYLISSQQLWKVGTSIISVVQMRKLRQNVTFHEERNHICLVPSFITALSWHIVGNCWVNYLNVLVTKYLIPYCLSCS